MPKIKFIVVGNTRSSFLREGERSYLERIGRYAPVEWVEIKGQKVSKGRSREEIVRGEAQAIAKKCLAGDHVIALDLKGKEYDSEGLAALVERLSQTPKQLCFVIGGPLSLAQEILAMARHRISLSRLTLTHEMSRLVLLEQIYRAHTIIRGEKYHK